MENILVLDSGIGGLSVLLEIVNSNCKQKLRQVLEERSTEFFIIK